MNYDIRVFTTNKKGRFTSIENQEGLTVFNLFFSDMLEFKKAFDFVTDCIIDGMGAKEIFEIAKKKDFSKRPSEIVKKVEEKSKYKIRKFLGSYYFSYSK